MRAKRTTCGGTPPHTPALEDVYCAGFWDAIELAVKHHHETIAAIDQVQAGLITFDELRQRADAILELDDAPHLPRIDPRLPGPCVPIEFRSEP